MKASDISDEDLRKLREDTKERMRKARENVKQKPKNDNIKDVSK